MVNPFDPTPAHHLDHGENECMRDCQPAHHWSQDEFECDDYPAFPTYPAYDYECRANDVVAYPDYDYQLPSYQSLHGYGSQATACGYSDYANYPDTDSDADSPRRLKQVVHAGPYGELFFVDEPPAPVYVPRRRPARPMLQQPPMLESIWEEPPHNDSYESIDTYGSDGGTFSSARTSSEGDRGLPSSPCSTPVRVLGIGPGVASTLVVTQVDFEVPPESLVDTKTPEAIEAPEVTELHLAEPKIATLEVEAPKAPVEKSRVAKTIRPRLSRSRPNLNVVPPVPGLKSSRSANKAKSDSPKSESPSVPAAPPASPASLPPSCPSTPESPGPQTPRAAASPSPPPRAHKAYPRPPRPRTGKPSLDLRVGDGWAADVFGALARVAHKNTASA